MQPLRKMKVDSSIVVTLLIKPKKMVFQEVLSFQECLGTVKKPTNLPLWAVVPSC